MSKPVEAAFKPWDLKINAILTKDNVNTDYELPCFEATFVYSKDSMEYFSPEKVILDVYPTERWLQFIEDLTADKLKLGNFKIGRIQKLLKERVIHEWHFNSLEINNRARLEYDGILIEQVTFYCKKRD